ncbi:hypothetical protein ACFXTO_019493 [Malus domestica]
MSLDDMIKGNRGNRDRNRKHRGKVLVASVEHVAPLMLKGWPGCFRPGCFSFAFYPVTNPTANAIEIAHSLMENDFPFC